MGKLDRDRARNFKKSTAFDEAGYRIQKGRDLEKYAEFLNKRIKESDDRLWSAWERKFIFSCLEQLTWLHRPLTSKQWVFLDSIFEKSKKMEGL